MKYEISIIATYILMRNVYHITHCFQKNGQGHQNMTHCIHILYNSIQFYVYCILFTTTETNKTNPDCIRDLSGEVYQHWNYFPLAIRVSFSSIRTNHELLYLYLSIVIKQWFIFQSIKQVDKKWNEYFFAFHFPKFETTHYVS